MDKNSVLVWGRNLPDRFLLSTVSGVLDTAAFTFAAFCVKNSPHHPEPLLLCSYHSALYIYTALLIRENLVLANEHACVL